MKYLNEQGLAKVRQADSDRLDRLYRKKSSGLWVQSEKAGAVGIYPVGGSELHPVVDFKFTETLPEGDKGPDNPSTITGVSQVKVGRCGKNLFNVHGTLFQASPFTITDDDFLELSRTNNTDAQQYNAHLIVPSPSIQSNETYTLVVEIKEISNCNVLFNMRDSYGQRGQLNTGYVLYNTVGTYFKICTNNNLYNPNCILRVMISSNPGNSYSLKVRFSIIKGIINSSNFEYMPYSGNDYTINLGNTYYGGSVDLSTGVMTVTQQLVELNENTYLSGSIFEEHTNVYTVGFYPNPERLKTILDATSCGCSILPVVISSGWQDYKCIHLAPSAMAVRINLLKSDLGLGDGLSISDVKPVASAWLGQHPSVLIYPIAEPYTIQLTPTQISALTQTDKYTPRLNTLYTDQEALQVGYLKSPARTSYEIDQAIIEGGA